jgi:uncharacterized protein DUF3515
MSGVANREWRGCARSGARSPAGARAVAAALTVLTLAACAGPVNVAAPAPTGEPRHECRRLLTDVPDTVDGQQRRDVSPADALAAAWGDPAIVLRCGVTRPQELKPTSECFRVDGVDWLAVSNGHEVAPARPVTGTLVFTTIGRSAYVEVTVPHHYQPAADVLVDLARPVQDATRVRSRCR